MGTRRGNGEGEIERLPSGKYRARRSKVIGGELVRESKTFDRRGAAQDWLRDHAAPARAGTVGEWLDTWIGLLTPDRAAKTISGLTYRVERWLKPKLGAVKLRDLDKLTCARFLATLGDGEDGASESERTKAGWVLRQALRSAVDHDQIPVSPMAGVRVKNGHRAEKRAFTEDQLRAVLTAAQPHGLTAAFQLWADAGLRPGEMYALEWADFDFRAGTVRVTKSLDGYTHKVKEPKTRGSRRTIRLAPATVKALVAARPVHARLVMPNTIGTWMWEDNFRRLYFNDIRTAAGVPWATAYTFRHTCATILLRAGVQMRAVSERLGHSNVTTTLRHYAHAVPDDENRAATVMERVFGAVPHELPTDARNG